MQEGGGSEMSVAARRERCIGSFPRAHAHEKIGAAGLRDSLRRRGCEIRCGDGACEIRCCGAGLLCCRGEASVLRQ